MPPGGHGAPRREAGVWAHAASPALCVLRGDTWPCPLLSGCSFAESCVLGTVSGIGESALHRVCMVGAATTRIDRSNLLQALPWMLAGPGHAVMTEGVFKGCAGESQSPLPSPGCTKQTPPALPHTGQLQTRRHPGHEAVTHPLIPSLTSTVILGISCSPSITL